MAHYWKAQAKEVNRGTAPSVGRYAASDARRPETLDSPFGFVGILNSDPMLFIRGDEAEEAWRIIDPVMHAWTAGNVPMQQYPAGQGPPGPPS